MDSARWYSKRIMVSLGAGGEKYGRFLTAMRDFKDGKISDTEAVARVTELLHDHHNLLFGLRFFLQTTFRIDTDDDLSLLQRKQFRDDDDDDDDDDLQIRHDAADNCINKASSSQPITVDEGSQKGKFSDVEVSQIHQVTEFVNKVRERFNDDSGAYKYFLDIIGTYKEEGSPGGKEIKRLFKNHPDLYIEFTRFEADCYTTVGMKRLRKFEEKGKTDDDQSYQKHCKKHNPYETMMLKCEDEQFEVDVQLNRLESAIIRMTKFLEVVKEKGVQIDVKTFFTPMDLRCIEQISDRKDKDGGYGTRGVIDLLCAYPVESSTSILNRLIQKFKELQELRQNANRVWAKVYKDCHEKMGKNCK